MSGNQVQVPVIQNGDKDIVQLQQNANKVLRYLQSQIDSLNTFMNQSTIIVEIKVANITVAQFINFAGSDWIQCNGQSCVGTAYSLLTNNNTVPTITSPLGVSGAVAMIRVN